MRRDEHQDAIGSNTSSGISAQFSMLVIRLKELRAMYEFDEVEDRRFAAKLSLAACNRFIIRSVPNGIDLVKPIRELLDCLSDLDKGISSPMLASPRKKKGGRPISRGLETFRATAAVLMEMYKREGKLRLDAAEAAASDLNEWGYCDERGKAITAERLEDWRDKANEGGDGLEAKRFKALCQELKLYNFEVARQAIFDSLSLIPGNRMLVSSASEANS